MTRARISVVVPIFDENALLDELRERLTATLDRFIYEMRSRNGWSEEAGQVSVVVQ